MQKKYTTVAAISLFSALCICYSHKQLSTQKWSRQAQTDLQFIHKTIQENHPGPVDPEATPHFKIWSDSGYSEALNRAESASTLAEYFFTLLYYVNGFRDAHVKLNSSFFKQLSISWPGFLVEYRNGSFYVAHAEENWNGTLPPIGAEIVQLNEKNPNQLMLSNIFPYFGNEQFEKDWAKNAPLLLLDCGNPWQEFICSCTYKVNGDEQTIRLKKEPIRTEILEPLIKKITKPFMSKFDKKELKNNGIWISIPTFNGSNQKIHKILESLISYIKTVSDKNYIVFDVRGNGGGASDYAERIVRNLFGNKAVDEKLGNMLNAPRSYRVSPDNIAHYKELLQIVSKNYGANSEAYNNWVNGMLTCVEDAQKTGKSLATYQPPIATTNDSSLKEENYYKKPIYLLTDGGCFSACLMFADMLLAFDNVIQVGLPTGGDTPYAEVRTVPLPGKGLSLLIPTNIRHNLARKNNQCYIPKHRYEGDVNNTERIKQWIEHFVVDK